MASNGKAAMDMASKYWAGVPMATNSNIASTTTPEMDEGQMPPDDENQALCPSVSHSQIDGGTETKIELYVQKPPTLLYAKVQGLARLKEMLNDPDGEIAHNIKKTNGWNVESLASNEKCKKVRQFITGDEKAPMTDETVPFILATWCMLGGFIPSMWREKVPGQKRGCGPLTDWGRKMIDELEHLGGSGQYEFELCNRYATKTVGRKYDFDWTEAAKGLEKWDDNAEQAKKKSMPNAQPTSLGKHGASSLHQQPAAKRPRAVAPRQIGGGFHAGDDDIEDEEGQIEVDSSAMGGGKKKGLPASKTPSNKANLSRDLFPRTKVNDHGDEDQGDALLPPRNKWALSGAHRNRGPDNSLGNSVLPRLYGPGLKTSKMSAKKKFTGRKSQCHNKGDTVSKPTQCGITLEHLSVLCRNRTSSSGQPSFPLSPSLRRREKVGATSKAYSPPQSDFTTTNRGDPASVYEAVSYPDEAGASISGARPSNTGHDSRHSTAQSKELSQQLKEKDEQIADVTAGDSSCGAFVHRSEGNPEVEIDKLKAEIEKLNAEKETQLMEVMSARSQLQITEIARHGDVLHRDDIIREYKVKLDRMFSIGEENDRLKDQISDLHEALDASLQTVEASSGKIAALEEEVKNREGVIDDRAQLARQNTELQEALDHSRRIVTDYKHRLDTTTAEAILEVTAVAAKDKGLSTISLKELLDGMFPENDDGSGTSMPKDPNQGHDDGADEEAPADPKENTGEVAADSADLGEHEGQEDGEGQGENLATLPWWHSIEVSSDSDSDSDVGGYQHGRS